MVTNLFAPNSSQGEQIKGAYMPCWVLQSMTAVVERVRENKTKQQTRIKLKQIKTKSIWKNEKQIQMDQYHQCIS
jgi:hypothetical protein